MDSQNDWEASPRRDGESPDLAAMARYLARLAGDGHAFAAGQSHIRPLGGGFNNRIYEVNTDGGIYLVKVYPADRGQRLEREYATMKRLSFLEAVPEAVTGDPWAVELKAPVLIYEKLPGAAVKPASMTREELSLLLEIMHAVHGISDPGDSALGRPAGPARPRDCLDFMDETMHAMATSAAMSDPPFREALDRLRDLRRCLDMMDLKPALWADCPPCLCHGDFRPANVIRAGAERIGLVDWEHAGIMDPLFEVAGFFWHPESAVLEAGLREEAIGDYCERSADPHAIEKMAVYQSILPVQWCVRILSLIEGYDREAVQPWSERRPPESLWDDLDRYIGLAAERLGATLRGPA
ncbi:MAG: aminoglycoside phosphotransferase family protein [Gemmatimonadetes bacterium]|nr:aminoglycoside phosphotransferase family protein [Gemmatimonadota bacterium]